MDDPDQPSLNDPRRKEYDFLQARAAIAQMSSGNFGGHNSAILPDVVEQQATGESKRSRVETMISEMIQGAATQIIAGVSGLFQVEQARQRPVDPATIQQAPQQPIQPPQVVQPQVQQQAPPPRVLPEEPIFVQRESIQDTARAPMRELSFSIPDPPQSGRSPEFQPPTMDEIRKRELPSDFNQTGQEVHRSPLQAMDRMAPPEKPIQDIRASTLVEKPRPQPVDPQEPARSQPRPAPQWTPDKASWFSGEPFSDPGGQTADPKRSAYQNKNLEQTMVSTEAMDKFGSQMVWFAESIEDSLRVLTRRLNDITRAIQGEGYDIR